MEDLSETQNRSDFFSYSFKRSPKSSIIDVTSENSNPTASTNKNVKHISFSPPITTIHDSKDSTINHSNTMIRINNLFPRFSLGIREELKEKNHSLKKLRDKLSRITEEFDTARDTKAETARETARIFEKEPDYYYRQAVEAKDLDDDFEYRGFPILR